MCALCTHVTSVFGVVLSSDPHLLGGRRLLLLHVRLERLEARQHRARELGRRQHVVGVGIFCADDVIARALRLVLCDCAASQLLVLQQVHGVDLLHVLLLLMLRLGH